MVSYATIFAATVPVFLIIATGYGLRSSGLMPRAADRTMLALTLHITYPCYILHALAGSTALREPGNLLAPVLCGMGFVLLGLAIGWLAGPLCGLRTGGGRRTFSLATAVQNYGYLPIPIMEAIFPDAQWKGVVFVYTLGIEVAIWTAGVMILSGDWRSGLRKVRNPVVGAIVLGVALNLLRWDAFYPGWLMRFIAMMGACAFPLGIMVSGATLADLLAERGALSGGWKTAAGSIALRLAVLPALMLAGAHWLPLTTTLREVLAIQAAMPAAVFPILMARQYGGHEITAVRVLVFTTAASFFTMPAAIVLALKWVHS